MGIVRVVAVFEQTGFDARLEWGVEGARVLAGRRDEPRSTGAPPRGSPDPSGPGGRPPYSLSPVSLLDVPPGTRLVLPSPNGSAVAAAIAHAVPVVLAGCLRNAAAVARVAREAGGDGPVAVVPVLRDGAFTAA
jgi:2-phosphosulfolactate phosphatase